MNAKTKILNYLSKSGPYNTLTTAQARSNFGIVNVSARIDELRKEGHAIYTKTRRMKDGRKVAYYRLGTPSKKVIGAGVIALREQGFRVFT
jgi:hypothetical protein